MENKVDKLTAEKLEGLDSLPNGYAPDLDSKWALLEETINKPVALDRYNIKWLSIAASILLSCGIGLWLSFKHYETTELSQKNIPMDKQTQKYSTAENKESGKIKNDKILNKIEKLPPAAHRKEITTRENKIVEENIVENFQSPKKDSVSNVVPSSTQEPVIVQVNEKTKKQRYVQMDFNVQSDGKYPADIQRTTAQLFRIKINSGDEANVVSNSENKFPIKLSHKF